MRGKVVKTCAAKNRLYAPVGRQFLSTFPFSHSVLWKKTLKEVIEMEEVTFNRSVKPENVKGQPSLVCFHDGSKRGIRCNIYIRWKFIRPRVDNIEERHVE